jgi:hypothetical protein
MTLEQREAHFCASFVLLMSVYFFFRKAATISEQTNVYLLHIEEQGLPVLFFTSSQTAL